MNPIPSSSTHAGPSRPKPPPPAKKIYDYIDLTMSSDDEDDGCQVLPSRPRPVARVPEKGLLKPTTKSNLPPIRPNPHLSPNNGRPKSSTFRPSRPLPSSSSLSSPSKKLKGATQVDAIPIASSDSGHSSIRATSSNSSDIVIYPSRTPGTSGVVKKPSGSVGAHALPKQKSATPSLGEGRMMKRTMSREKVEIGSRSGSTSRSTSGVGSSSKKDRGAEFFERLGASIKRKETPSESSSSRIKSTKPERNYPIFSSSQSQTQKVKVKVKHEPNPSPRKPSATQSVPQPSHSRKSSSSFRVKAESTPRSALPKTGMMDEVDGFFSPANPLRPSGGAVISSKSAARASAREKSMSTTSADRTPTKVRSNPEPRPVSGEKRKRYTVVEEEDFVPPVRTHRPGTSVDLKPALKARVRVRSERTANQPPVNYVVPTMDDPLDVWTRTARTGAGTPKRALTATSSALSSAPPLTRSASISSQSTMPTLPAEVETREPSPKRRKSSKTPSKTPSRAAVRNGSDTSALTSMSSQSTPGRITIMSAQNTPMGRKSVLSAGTPRQQSGKHESPNKTPKAQTVVVMAAEVSSASSDDMLDLFADYEFAPSPEAPRTSPTAVPSPMMKGEPSTEDCPGSAARRLSFSGPAPSSPTKTVKIELSPGALRAKKEEEELEAKRVRIAALDAATAQAAAESQKRWRDLQESQAAVLDDDDEFDEPIESIEEIARQAVLAPRRPTRTASSGRTASSKSIKSPVSTSVPRGKRTKQDHATRQIFNQIGQDHLRDTSFEAACEYSRAESRSPEHSSPSERGRGTQAFAYPTPTSRDPSVEPSHKQRDLERMIPEVVIPIGHQLASPVKPRTLADITNTSLQDLDADMRGGAADMIREAKALATARDEDEEDDELPWEGVWVAPAPIREAEEGVEAALDGVWQGMWGVGVKSARRGDFGILAMLISSIALKQLSEENTQALAKFCLYTWLRNGAEGAMNCLYLLADMAIHHPFTSSSIVRDITCTMLASVGIDELVLPNFTPIEGQPIPTLDRDGTIASFAILLKKLSLNMLGGSEAIALAPVLCAIYADPSTFPMTKDLLQSALKEMWTVCLEEYTALQVSAKICDFAETLPSCAQREVLFSIGMTTEASRAISQWVAAGLLTGAPSEEDKSRNVPTISSIEAAVKTIFAELRDKQPDHSLLDRQLSCLYLMSSNVNDLVYSSPIPTEGELCELSQVRRLLARADSQIRQATAASRLEISNKMRLSQLSAVLGAKIASALQRRRQEESQRKAKEMKENGKGLQEGVGGQSKLFFAKKEKVT